jgi:RNA-binding protein NOB1
MAIIFHFLNADEESAATAATASSVSALQDTTTPSTTGATSTASGSAPAQASLPGWGGDEETNEPDEGTWITPDNVQDTVHQLVEVEEPTATTPIVLSTVAVITTDFAMQNVIMQMGLRLVSVNGLAITTVRSWLKKCHGCFRMERDVTREFCSNCGGHTLFASFFVNIFFSFIIFFLSNCALT